MKNWLFILFTIGLVSCGKSDHTTIEVSYKGALKNIMHKGDLSAKVDLSEYKNSKNLYALGAIENLKGEIQIFDGKPYNSIVDKDSILFDTSYDKKATLLVTANVENWVSIPIPDDVISKKDLEKYLEKIADEYKINTNEPFPFLIQGEVQSLDWHVINWKDGDTEHSHEKHIKSGLHGTLGNTPVEMLGFYSDSHHAIFTHHTTNMHIHIKTANGKIAGHVDELILGKEMILQLPKVN